MKIETHNNGILTRKKLKIIRLVALGKSNWDISKIEGTAEQTVANQISEIFTKLNAVNRAHAVAIAVSKGIISINTLLLALVINASDADMRRGARRPSRRRIIAYTSYAMKVVDSYYIPDRKT